MASWDTKISGFGTTLDNIGTGGQIVHAAVSNDGTKMAVVVDIGIGIHTLKTYTVDISTGTFTTLHPDHIFTANFDGSTDYALKTIDSDEQITINNDGSSIFVAFSPTNANTRGVLVHFSWDSVGSSYRDITTGNRTLMVGNAAVANHLTLNPSSLITGNNILGIVSNSDGSKVFARIDQNGFADRYIPLAVNPTTGELTFSYTNLDENYEELVGDVSIFDLQTRFSKELDFVAYQTAANDITMEHLNTDGSLTGSSDTATFTGTLQTVTGVSSSKLVVQTDTGVQSANNVFSIGTPVSLGAFSVIGDPTHVAADSFHRHTAMRDDASFIANNLDVTKPPYVYFPDFPTMTTTVSRHDNLGILGGNTYPLYVDDTSLKYIYINVNSGDVDIGFRLIEDIIEIVPVEEPVGTLGYVNQGVFGDNIISVDFEYNNTQVDVTNITPSITDLFFTPSGSIGPGLVTRQVNSNHNASGLFNSTYTLDSRNYVGILPIEEKIGTITYNIQTLFFDPPTFDLSQPVGTENIIVIPNTATGYADIQTVNVSDPRFTVTQTAAGWGITINDYTGLFDGQFVLEMDAETSFGMFDVLHEGVVPATITNNPTPSPGPVTVPETFILNVGGFANAPGPVNDTIPVTYNGNTTTTYNFDNTSTPWITSTGSGTNPNDITVSTFSTQPGFWSGTYTLDGNLTNNTTNKPANFLFLDPPPGPYDLSTTSSYDLTVLPGGPSAYTGLTNLTVSGLPPGVVFNSATSTLTIVSPNASAGTYTLTFTGTTSDGSTITIPYDIELTGTSPDPPVESGFTGGKYSSSSTAKSNDGNESEKIYTGTAISTSKYELQTKLLNHFEDMIKSRVDPNYSAPTIDDSNTAQFLYNDLVPGNYTSDYTNTRNFLLNPPSGPITDPTSIKKIDVILNNHFKQMRNFFIKFYNYEPGTNDTCDDGNTTPNGYSSCVKACYTTLNLMFNPL